MTNDSDISVLAEVTGSVWNLEVGEGDRVEKGTVLAILESMKMEIPCASPGSGRVTNVHVAEGDSVSEGDVLMVISAEDGDA